jgi:translation initiation factor IF-3
VIDDKGAQLGVMSVREALDIARERDLDLVEVAPNAEPPVCRLLEYGKFLYERSKREREARRSQKSTEIKEIRLRPKTGEHDIAFKMRDMRRFLNSGAKVKVRVAFRGREITHAEVGRAMLERIAGEMSDVAAVEQRPRLEGRSMLMILTPASK